MHWRRRKSKTSVGRSLYRSCGQSEQFDRKQTTRPAPLLLLLYIWHLYQLLPVLVGLGWGWLRVALPLVEQCFTRTPSLRTVFCNYPYGSNRQGQWGSTELSWHLYQLASHHSQPPLTYIYLSLHYSSYRPRKRNLVMFSSKALQVNQRHSK